MLHTLAGLDKQTLALYTLTGLDKQTPALHTLAACIRKA